MFTFYVYTMAYNYFYSVGYRLGFFDIIDLSNFLQFVHRTCFALLHSLASSPVCFFTQLLNESFDVSNIEVVSIDRFFRLSAYRVEFDV